MAAKSQILDNAMLALLLTNGTYTSTSTVYVALYTVAPTPTTSGTEVTSSGTGYARTAVTFSAPSGGSTSNSGTVTFPTATGAGWGTIVACAICNAATASGSPDSTILYFGNLTSSKTVGSGDTVSFAGTSLSVTEQ
jgi:hypothetical protein